MTSRNLLQGSPEAPPTISSTQPGGLIKISVPKTHVSPVHGDFADAPAALVVHHGLQCVIKKRRSIPIRAEPAQATRRNERICMGNDIVLHTKSVRILPA